MNRRFVSRRWIAITATAALAVASFAGCGGSSNGSGAGSGPLAVAVFQPFTGNTAFYGPEGNALCYTAMDAINAAGGVLGHKLNCLDFDSTADPADALPVANRMVASTKNLSMIYGPTSIEPAVEPILNTDHLVHFPDNGDPRYDHQTSPYFFRMVPSDALAGVSLAIYAADHGWKHVASVFTDDQSAQTSVPTLHATFPKLGGSFTTSLTLAPGQTSYRTEVSRIIASKPQAIVTEMDSQTAVTVLSEILQLNNGKLPQIVTTSRAEDPTWIATVLKAIGPQNFKRIIVITNTVPQSGPGYDAFLKTIKRAPQNIPQRAQYFTDPYVQLNYDGIVMGALAMLEAKSTDPTKWAPLVPKIGNGSPGAVVVHSFAAGKQAIASGKAIHYEGAAGSLIFNRSNNVSTPFAGYTWNGHGTAIASLVPDAGAITPAQLAQAQAK
jgi:branched-chain amino acid transport system substrate-binding protein